MSSTRSPEIKFWTSINRHGPTDYSFDDPCWLWLGVPTSTGYGQIVVDGRAVPVHRWSYQRFRGRIPKGYAIDHLCRVPLCVNPRHLEAVTQVENIMRGMGRPAQNARKTECPQGHPYSPENTYVRANGSRQCRICNRERRRK